MTEVEIVGVCPNCGEGVIEIEVDCHLGHICPRCNWGGALSEVVEPRVKARTIKRQDGIWDIYVTCPFCGKEHHHGGGDGERPILGGRLSHCQKNSREYVIV